MRGRSDGVDVNSTCIMCVAKSCQSKSVQTSHDGGRIIMQVPRSSDDANTSNYLRGSVGLHSLELIWLPPVGTISSNNLR